MTILGKAQKWAYAKNTSRRSYTIEFHPSSECVYSCFHCQGLPFREAWGVPPPKMSRDLVDRFFRAYDARKDKTAGIWRIIVSGMTGEPMQNREVVQALLTEAKERGVATGLSTSGLVMNEADRELITSANTSDDWLNLSADAPLGRDARFAKLYDAVHRPRGRNSLGKLMGNLERVAGLKEKKGSSLQINIDWIVSDLSIDVERVGDDLLETIDYLNGIKGVSLLRFQFPFHLNPGIPGLSDERSARLAAALKAMQQGRTAVTGLRDDFTVKLRTNWRRRVFAVRSCTAARDYGIVFGPDGRVYFCPYTASPYFKKHGALLSHITADNLWEVIEEIKPLDAEALTRCQMVCTFKDCFVDLGIVK